MSLYLIADLSSTLALLWVIVQVAVGLGFVIFVHELGHFLVAKACGVKCEKFYIGFDVGGRKLWSRQWGETEYGVGVVPLGGYVKMLGQDDNPSNIAKEAERSRVSEDQERAGESGDTPSGSDTDVKPPEGTKLDPRSYMAKSVPQRMAIISAGVVMNLIFAVIFAVVAFPLGVKQTPAVVGELVPGSPAWVADLRPGDELLSMGGRTDLSFRDVMMAVALFDKETGLAVTARRPSTSEVLKLNLQPQISEGRLVPAIGILSPSSLILGELEEGSFLADAGVELQEGDEISAVDGQPVNSHAELVAYLAQHPDQEIVLTVQREREKSGQETEGHDTDESPGAAAQSSARENGEDEAGRGEDGEDKDGGVENGAAKENEKKAANTEKIEVTIPPRPEKRLGLVMRTGPVTAVQKDSPAAEQGLEKGDWIVEMNGQPVGDPTTLPHRALKSAQADGQITLTIAKSGKNGERTTKTLSYRAPFSFGLAIAPGDPFVLPGLGVAYEVTNEVVDVAPGSPAARTNITTGDRIVAFKLTPIGDKEDLSELAKRAAKRSELELGKDEDDQDKGNWPLVARLVDQAPSGLQVALTLERDGETRTVELTPVDSTEWRQADRGIETKPLRRTRTAKSFDEAVRLGTRETWHSVTMVYRFLRKLGTQISFKALGGPMTIAHAAGSEAFQGLGNLLVFLTLLSANLAVINFLPIPVLDGGHMVFLLWEGIFRKPMSERLVIAFHMLGFAFIISLMLFVIGLEVLRYTGLM